MTSCRCWGSFGLPCLVVASILRVFFAYRDGSSHCHGVCYALQVFPGGHQVDGLPPASSMGKCGVQGPIAQDLAVRS